jgi:very-short-patch-repair endonuclease
MTRSKIQKIALRTLLQKRFGQVECEKTFDWLKTPRKGCTLSECPADYKTIIKALCDYRNRSDFFGMRSCKLKCDFVIEKRKLIIEYDERQHFTAARKIALKKYPKDVRLHFSQSDWVKHCETINAHDNDPPYRDEQRALYDSLRDIEAFCNGWTLIRIKDGDIDWTTANTGTFNKLLNHGNHR